MIKPKDAMERVCVHLPVTWILEIDKIVNDLKSEGYTRSDFIREAIYIHLLRMRAARDSLRVWGNVYMLERKRYGSHNGSKSIRQADSGRISGERMEV